MYLFLEIFLNKHKRLTTLNNSQNSNIYPLTEMPSIPPYLEPWIQRVSHLSIRGITILKGVPVLNIVINYIQNSYQNDPFRIFLEVLLILFALFYVFNKDRTKFEPKLSEKEIDLLIEDWKPEPLVVQQDMDDYDPIPFEIEGPSSLRVKVKGTKQIVNNWSTGNFLNLQNDARINDIAIETVKKAGVGACGPAGFYGFSDIHLDLERQIANLLGRQEAILYSQGFMAVCSVIPAFSKRGDIIIADEAVGAAIQTGLEISRSHIYFFHHNDMDDLERVLQEVNEEFRRLGRPLSRRFIAVEAIYGRTGDLCPLKDLVALKEKYKYRLILDESLSLGVLGKNGLGASEHWGVPVDKIDIQAGSLSLVLGSSGGWCAGAKEVVDHQRLNSQAYCYSAALPALHCKAASLAITLMSKEGRREALLKAIDVFDNEFSSTKSKFIMEGSKESPIRFLVPSGGPFSDSVASDIVEKTYRHLLSKGHLVGKRKIDSLKFQSSPAIKICISSGHSHEALKDLCKLLV